ncbi:MAG: manganese efflux pump MntP family protein [Spirochaetaceae bacterium]|nr:manganese efflux pump MntP family protein [Spirochaetaceae bacterium]
MNIIYILGIAFALSIDAFAVSVIHGATAKDIKFKEAFLIAFSFGSFQAIMPFIGWSAGLLFKEHIQNIDHWIAFILLAIIGGKMIYGSIFGKEEKDNEYNRNKLNIFTLLMLSIATSIDALAVGLSFSIINIAIFFPVLIIGSVTFFVCLTGVYIGDRVGSMFGKKLEIAGGIILILIGARILISHIV